MGKHTRHITEKELKIAARNINLQHGLIEYIISEVRVIQQNSEEKTCQQCKYFNEETYHDKMYCRDCRQRDRFTQRPTDDFKSLYV